MHKIYNINYNGIKFLFKDFLAFIRLRICLYITSIAVFGYLMFNPLDIKTFFVALSAFCLAACVYSFNMITDKQEDMINAKRLNYFVLNKKGPMIVILFLISGGLLTLSLSGTTSIIYIAGSASGILYSFLRMKRIFPIKNLYTGLITSLAFLAGSTVNSIAPEIFIYIVLVMIPVFKISLLGDLRDYEGDKNAKLKTVPVVMGYKTGKNLVYFLSFVFVLVVLLSQLTHLMLMLPFIIPVMIFLNKNKPDTSQFYLLLAFMLLPFSTLVI